MLAGGLSCICAVTLVLVSSNNEWQETRDICAAMLVFVETVRLQRFALANPKLGPLQLQLYNMMVDAVPFVFLFASVVLSFGLMLFALNRNDEDFNEKFRDILPILQNLLWLSVFDGHLPEDEDAHASVNRFRVTYVMLTLYSGLGGIIFLNLLIAMFNDGFARVQEAKDIEFKALSWNIVLDFANRPMFPLCEIVYQYFVSSITSSGAARYLREHGCALIREQGK